MATNFHNTKLQAAVEDFELAELNEADVTRDVTKGDGGKVHTISVLDSTFEYSGEDSKHQRNSDYYRLLNRIAGAKKQEEKAQRVE